MHKLLAFDLDGTLAPIGRGMLEEDAETLRALERLGYRIVVASGKPTFYLCGFMRQIGLESPILMGENGGVIQFGCDLPPVRYHEHAIGERARKRLEELGGRIERRFGDKVWFQPNRIALTAFPQGEEIFDPIEEVIVDSGIADEGFAVYRHADSFDVVPQGVDKFAGMERLAALLGIEAGDCIAVGDGVNDVPMFEFADISIAIGKIAGYEATRSFPSIGAALGWLMESRA